MVIEDYDEDLTLYYLVLTDGNWGLREAADTALSSLTHSVIVVT